MEEEKQSSSALELNIKVMNGDPLKINIPPTASVLNLKTEIQGRLGVDPSQQRLIFCGKVLEDRRSLASYGLETGHSIHFVRRPPPAPSSSATRGSSGGASSSRPSMTGGQSQANNPTFRTMPMFDVAQFGQFMGEVGNGENTVMATAGFGDLENMIGQLVPNLLGGNPNFTMEVGTFPVQVPNQNTPNQNGQSQQQAHQNERTPPSSSAGQGSFDSRPAPAPASASRNSSNPQPPPLHPQPAPLRNSAQANGLPGLRPNPPMYFYPTEVMSPPGHDQNSLVRHSTNMLRALQPFITAMHQQLGTTPLSTGGPMGSRNMSDIQAAASTSSPDRARARPSNSSTDNTQNAASDEAKAPEQTEGTADNTRPPTHDLLPLSQGLDVLFQTIHSTQIPLLRMATALRDEADLVGENRSQASLLAIQMGTVLRQLSSAMLTLSMVMEQLSLGESPGDAEFVPSLVTLQGPDAHLRRQSSVPRMRRGQTQENRQSQRQSRGRQVGNLQVRMVARRSQSPSPNIMGMQMETQRQQPAENNVGTPQANLMGTAPSDRGRSERPSVERTDRRRSRSRNRAPNPNNTNMENIGQQLGPLLAQMAATLMSQPMAAGGGVAVATTQVGPGTTTGLQPPTPAPASTPPPSTPQQQAAVPASATTTAPDLQPSNTSEQQENPTPTTPHTAGSNNPTMSSGPSDTQLDSILNSSIEETEQMDLSTDNTTLPENR